jgi:GMP synthase-like glutamine amidotransferase
MKVLSLEQLGWRNKPGILSRHVTSPQSVHALLGYFLKDRVSPTPFPGRDMLANEGFFEWGIAPPLEKVIESARHLDVLLRLPELYRQSVAVIEPWSHVGTNALGEPVRASKNIAYLLQQIADADTVLYPVWHSGITHPERLANVLGAGIATIVQGGDPSVHDARSFAGSNASLDDLLGLIEQLLLRRSFGSGPCIFICLGHQLAAASHIRLLQRVVREVAGAARLPLDPGGHALRTLQGLCRRIASVGETLPIVKQGQPVATGWNDCAFAVARNENVEVGARRLLPYTRRGNGTHIPAELHDAHALVADELDGVIDMVMALERDLTVQMFHSDEVNEEAVLFANWAYRALHDAIVPIRHELAVGPLGWLLSLPYAVEILAQTAVDAESWTEVSTTAIYYKDWETHRIRRSFTCQFHPELMADIRDIGGRTAPRYKELKEHDGVRLLARLLYHGMQE